MRTGWGPRFLPDLWILIVGPVKRAPVNCHASVLRALNPGAHAVGGEKVRVRCDDEVLIDEDATRRRLATPAECAEGCLHISMKRTTRMEVNFHPVFP